MHTRGNNVFGQCSLQRQVLIKKKILNKYIAGFSQMRRDGWMRREERVWEKKDSTGRRHGGEREVFQCECVCVHVCACTAVIAWQLQGYLTCVTAAARVCHLYFTARLCRSSLVCVCVFYVVHIPVASKVTLILVFLLRLPLSVSPSSDLIALASSVTLCSLHNVLWYLSVNRAICRPKTWRYLSHTVTKQHSDRKISRL